MFFSRIDYTSSKNGTITVTKFPFSTPSIIVSGCMQSGSYIIAMWKSAFKKLPKIFSPKSILIFGLGGGNTVQLLQKKYVGAHITVIEWDEVMIALAKDLELFATTDMLTIKHQDAFDVLRTREEQYDLVIVDLFTGDMPPEELTDTSVLNSLASILNNDGYMLVNFFKHTKYAASFDQVFPQSATFSFEYNTLGLYSKTVAKE